MLQTIRLGYVSSARRASLASHTGLLHRRDRMELRSRVDVESTKGERFVDSWTNVTNQKKKIA